MKYDSDYLLRLRDGLHQTPVESVPLRALTIAESPRNSIENPEHTRTLAELDQPFPPIVVHRDSMTVIDGIHRLRATELQGRAFIDVRFFEGNVEDSRLLAVALNVVHGLPLSLEERSEAAKRIFTRYPEWSDRSVASIAGLSPKKAADIRHDLFGDTGIGERRVGRDGRARPLEPSQGRALAGLLIAKNPGASLRQVAKEAGVSPTTVADVRDRMARGESPTLPEPRPRQSPLARRPPRRTSTAVSPSGSDAVPVTELVAMLELLRRDPSLRLSEAGRSILRLLDASAAFARNREGIIASLPPHCKTAVARLAHGYARSWQQFASELRD
ncbi:transcriptional regulator [Streptomyces sp. NPDC046984]|uniref:transcriptional regulator n=1 Tax=Streptomyces sp. NPDC046984 TaxID=3155138 RepID=UPI0033E0A6D4